jgi:hypothetical protein
VDSRRVITPHGVDLTVDRKKVSMNEANKKVDAARGKCQVGMPLDEGSDSASRPHLTCKSIQPSDEGSAQQIEPVRCPRGLPSSRV